MSARPPSFAAFAIRTSIRGSRILLVLTTDRESLILTIKMCLYRSGTQLARKDSEH